MNYQIAIFTTPDGKIQIEVQFEGDSFWLTLNQIASLFEKDKSVISRHLRNIFIEGELDRNSTVAKIATVQQESNRQVKRQIEYFNLDAILSVGYRVNSKRGTQFRQWANQRLKEYLVQGIAINQKRLEQQNKELQILHDGIRILSRAIEEQESTAFDFSWLQRFSLGLQLLDDYDHESLDLIGKHQGEANFPTIEEYDELISNIRSVTNSDIFGKEKDEGFVSAIQQIAQQFDGKALYPSIEEKASMLLYLIIKNHAFIDGNKRIAAACFLLFLNRNNVLYTPKGNPIISTEALASLTLFVATSKPEEMETVKNLLVSVMNRNA